MSAYTVCEICNDAGYRMISHTDIEGVKKEIPHICGCRSGKSLLAQEVHDTWYVKKLSCQLCVIKPKKLFHAIKFTCWYDKEFQIFEAGIALLGYGLLFSASPKMTKVEGMRPMTPEEVAERIWKKHNPLTCS